MSNLIRRDPLDDLFRGFFVRPVDFGSQPDAPAVKIDVKEQEKSYLVHAEIPGVKKDDIHVAVDGAIVSISAERREEKDVKEGERVLRTERYFGKVSRSFQLAQESTKRRWPPNTPTACLNWCCRKRPRPRHAELPFSRRPQKVGAGDTLKAGRFVALAARRPDSILGR